MFENFQNVLRKLTARVNIQTRTGACIDAALLAAITVAMLFWRRPDQFLHPAIWVEEGPYILRPYVEQGWASLLEPIHGYTLFISKLLAFISYEISIIHAPAIGVGLTVAFTSLVIISIYLSPTSLPWKKACALVPLLIPTDSEVFTVTEYAFWWAGIWVILPLLWRRGTSDTGIRLGMLLIGGLSSPLIVPLSGLYAVRAFVERRKIEWLLAALAIAIAIAQAVTIYAYGIKMTNTEATIVNTPVSLLSIHYFIGVIFGSFLHWSLTGDLRNGLGMGFAVFLLLIAFMRRRALDRNFLFLIAIFILICVSVFARIPQFFVDSGLAIKPMGDGPRYFFYPFILMGWAILWLGSVSPWWLRGLLCAFLVYVVVGSWTKFPRYHERIDWAYHMRKCAKSDSYFLPVHAYGTVQTIWPIEFKGAQCRKLIDESIF